MNIITSPFYSLSLNAKRKETHGVQTCFKQRAFSTNNVNLVKILMGCFNNIISSMKEMFVKCGLEIN